MQVISVANVCGMGKGLKMFLFTMPWHARCFVSDVFGTCVYHVFSFSASFGTKARFQETGWQAAMDFLRLCFHFAEC